MNSEISVEQLISNLKQFTGTQQYARLTRTVVLTEGALYLAEEASSYWLFDLYASHLSAINSSVDEFTCLKLNKENSSATVVIDDGNNNVLAKQFVEFTDFPLNAITLYACWAGDYWVVMLPSEY
jgi:hypothetical protein